MTFFLSEKNGDGTLQGVKDWAVLLAAAELFVSLATSSRRVRDECGLWTAL